MTAAVSALSIALLVLAWQIVPGQPPDCMDAPCPPSVDRHSGPVEPLHGVLAAVGMELVVIGWYLIYAVAARTLDLRAVMRWAPVTVAVVVLAVASFGWLLENGAGKSYDPAELGFLIVLGAWLLVPLLLYVVHRGDRTGALLVAAGLAPTALGNALLIRNDPLGFPMAIPAVMLAIGVGTLLIVRRRTT
ncbi:hypothetical protein [Kribbella sp. NPDC048915]|uniref:hypothetical protein n=1 Tax=Kribbella sp. NPDC048915 TaxID=3155148 RepID=UPI0033CB4BBB